MPPKSLIILSSLLLLPACSGDGPDGLDGPEDKPKPTSIEGRVLDDLNRDGLGDPAQDRGIAGASVYLDSNDNDQRDEGEPQVLTDSDGRFLFENLAAGSYVVRQELEFGWKSAPILQSARTGSLQAGGLGEAPGREAHIIGGGDAAAGRFPFMVSLGWDFSFGDAPEYFHLCGGTLISDRFILTAAHCSEGAAPDSVVAKLGSMDPTSGDGTIVELRNILIHPSFNGDVVDGHDFALWELSAPVDFAASGVRTVDLMPHDIADGELATTIGWGDSDNSSKSLQEVHVPIVGDETCATQYPEVETFETQICAGSEAGGLDSCQGDSGGPLLVRDLDSRQWRHAGVTSWGTGCALAGFSGVYAETSAALPWILDQLREEPTQEFAVELGANASPLVFLNIATISPLIEEVDTRLSVSGLTLAGSESGQVEVDAALQLKFTLHTDSDEAADLSCEFDPDGAGELPAASIECHAGANLLDVAGYAEGVFEASLQVSTSAGQHQRGLVLVVGEPEGMSVTGALSAEDQIDPDYPGSSYFVDYYELSNVLANNLTVVSIESTFAVELLIYDADLRGEFGGGTVVSVQGENSAQLTFKPEEGKRYWIGVTTLDEEATGDYSVKLVNNGRLDAVSASL